LILVWEFAGFVLGVHQVTVDHHIEDAAGPSIRNASALYASFNLAAKLTAFGLYDHAPQ